MDWAIGKVIYVNDSPGVARIKVLAYNNNGYWSADNLETRFSPSGKVFAPNFKSDWPFFHANDIVRFNYIPNPKSSNRDDNDVIIIPSKRNDGHVIKCPKIYSLELEQIYNRTPQNQEKELCFFFHKNRSTSYICGPLYSDDLSPKQGKEVSAWNFRNRYDTIRDPDDGAEYLAVDIDEFTSRESAMQIDCMTQLQLKDWLLKEQLPGLFSQESLREIKDALKQKESPSDDDLSKQRFARIRARLNGISWTWGEMKNLAGLPAFKDAVEKTIQENIDKITVEYAKEIAEKKKDLQAEIVKAEADFAKVKKEKEKETKQLESAIQKQVKILDENRDAISSQAKDLETLQKNKDKLIDLIRIQAGIFSSATGNSVSHHAYPLEHINRQSDAQSVLSTTDRESFCDRVNESLEMVRGFMRPALKMLNEPDFCFKTQDIRTGIFLANVLGNTIYQLCQPSPKWVSFKDFWDDSLKNIWESAHANPDIWHILLIENFNLSLPECWGYPLWNLAEGKASLIPLARNPERPNNLKIIVSEASVTSKDNSHIGLVTNVGKNWSEMNVRSSWDEMKNDEVDTAWEKFIDNKMDGLAVNEEYFYPVKSK